MSMYTLIETKFFTRLVQEYLSDQEYSELQKVLMANPRAGQVIPGSGGVRKLRWRAPGRGKRGGYRVIYFVKATSCAFWMLTMYPKSVRDDISAQVLRRIRGEAEDESE